MPAKLDISKPLRLIEIQIFEDTSKTVRKSLNPGWYPFIKCENTDKMGTAKDKYPIVAGKNGSGKSTLIDALYRIINNFRDA